MFRRKSARTESDTPVTDPTNDPTARDIAHIRDYALRMRLASENQDGNTTAQDSAQAVETAVVEPPAVIEPSAKAPKAEKSHPAKVVNTTKTSPAHKAPEPVAPEGASDVADAVVADDPVTEDDQAEAEVTLPKAHELVDIPPALAKAASPVQSASRSSFESRMAAASEKPASIQRQAPRELSRPRPSIAPAMESHLPASQPMKVVRPEPVNAADATQSLRLSQIGTGTVGGESDGDVALDIRNIVIQGVTFRSPRSISPGTIRQLRMENDQATLTSKIRVVSCRLRSDGTFDIKAEFF